MMWPPVSTVRPPKVRARAKGKVPNDLGKNQAKAQAAQIGILTNGHPIGTLRRTPPPGRRPSLLPLAGNHTGVLTLITLSHTIPPTWQLDCPLLAPRLLLPVQWSPSLPGFGHQAIGGTPRTTLTHPSDTLVTCTKHATPWCIRWYIGVVDGCPPALDSTAFRGTHRSATGLLPGSSLSDFSNG